MSHQSTQSFQSKVQNFHKDIAKKQRQKIFAKRRAELFQSQQQHPLYSSVFSKYWDLSARQISLSLEQISQTLENVNTTQLLEQDHVQLCQDLVYLITTHPQFTLPFGFQFCKDASQYTAMVACYAIFSLTDQEITYWITYMSDQTRDLLYLQIVCSEVNFDRWIKNLDFLNQVVNDWGEVNQAEALILDLLHNISIEEDEEDSCLYQSLWDRIFELRKKNSLKYTATMLTILGMVTTFYASQSYDLKKKKFNYLKILLNQALIAIYEQDKHFDLGHEFTRVYTILSEQARQYVTQLFTKEGFNAMSELLVSNFRSKYIDQESVKYLKHTMNGAQVNNSKHKFIEQVLIICLNYLRINGSRRIKDPIPQKLFILIESQKEPSHYDKFEKLLNLSPFNNQKTPKNPIKLQGQPEFFCQNPSNNSQQQFQI